MKTFTVVYELSDGFINDFTCEAMSDVDAIAQCLAERGEATTIKNVVGNPDCAANGPDYICPAHREAGINAPRECIKCHHLETIGAHCAVTNGSHVFAVIDPFQDALPCWDRQSNRCACGMTSRMCLRVGDSCQNEKAQCSRPLGPTKACGLVIESGRMLGFLPNDGDNANAIRAVLARAMCEAQCSRSGCRMAFLIRLGMRESWCRHDTFTEDWPESAIEAMDRLTSAMQYILALDQDWEMEGYETFELLKGCRGAIHRECYP